MLGIPDDVDLWVARFSERDAVSESVLQSALDVSRYSRIVPPNRKRQFLFRRAIRHYVLSQYLSNYETEAVSQAPGYAAWDENRSLFFSSSSSANLCALGISRRQLGVDIEAKDTHVDIVGVCRRFLPDFSEALPASDSQHLHRHLALCSWCDLESYVKLHRTTLHELIAGDEQSMRTWQLRAAHRSAFVVGQEYVCAVSQGQQFRLRNVFLLEFNGVDHGPN